MPSINAIFLGVTTERMCLTYYILYRACYATAGADSLRQDNKCVYKLMSMSGCYNNRKSEK